MKVRLGDYEGAIADFDEAVLRLEGWSLTANGTTDDERALAILNRGYARLLLEDYGGALDDAHEA